MSGEGLEINHYELHLVALDSICVGTVRGMSASDAVRQTMSSLTSRLERMPNRPPVAITADHRASFLAALSAVWRQQEAAYLVPDPTLLARWDSTRLHLSAQLCDQAEPAPSPSLRLSWEADRTLAAVLTSGSTGAPSIHNKTAKQLVDETRALVKLLSLDRTDTVLATTASHHVYGLLFGVLVPWLGQARLVVDDRNEPAVFHPGTLADLAKDTKTTILVTVPAHLRSMLEADLDLTGIRQVISSAAPLAPKDAARFEQKFGVEVIDVLGSTETGGIATRGPARNLRWRPLPAVQVSVDQDDVLSVDSPWADKSSGLMETGERAQIFPDGSFEYLGRADGVVKVGGKRISLQEIDEVARRVPGVDDAVSFAQPVSSLRGVEIRLAAQSQKLSPQELKLKLRKVLDPVFVPRKIRVVHNLPRDERGKVKRAALEALFETAS